MKKYNPLFVVLLLLSACTDEAEFKVINKVSNSKLEKISYGKYNIDNSIITNETSLKSTIIDKKGSFPKNEHITFYMSANGNKVLLRTVNKYYINSDQDVTFIIDDSTDVVVP